MIKDLKGQKFSRLTVLEQSSTKHSKGIMWKCLCDCGNIKEVMSYYLVSGDTKSCGCLNSEKRLENIKKGYEKITKYSPKEASARRVWNKNYNDGISFEDFYEMSKKDCSYCGATPNNELNSAKETERSSNYAKENGDFIYNGLDRIDSSLPHTKTNCIPCCKYCNYAKRERNMGDFLLWILKVKDKYEKDKFIK